MHSLSNYSQQIIDLCDSLESQIFFPVSRSSLEYLAPVVFTNLDPQFHDLHDHFYEYFESNFYSDFSENPKAQGLLLSCIDSIFVEYLMVFYPDY